MVYIFLIIGRSSSFICDRSLVISSIYCFICTPSLIRTFVRFLLKQWYSYFSDISREKVNWNHFPIIRTLLFEGKWRNFCNRPRTRTLISMETHTDPEFWLSGRMRCAPLCPAVDFFVRQRCLRRCSSALRSQSLPDGWTNFFQALFFPVIFSWE